LNQECYKILYSVQKGFPKWARILPEVKNIQRAEYKLNNQLNEIIPIIEENGRESAKFEYRAYLDYLLSKFGLLNIVQDNATDVPVVVAVTFDGGAISKFVSHVTAVTHWRFWIVKSAIPYSLFSDKNSNGKRY